MRCLHLSNDYSGSTVYKNLCMALDYNGVTQTIYHPTRSVHQMDKNLIKFKEPNSKIFYSPILTNYSRIDFNFKKRRILKDLTLKDINASEYDVIHAHTWYSDGAIALSLKKRFGTPYIVTVRNTDLNLFFKYMVHLRKLGLEILRESENVVMISAQYNIRLKNLLEKYSEEGIIPKLKVIPNGIDPYWIENTYIKKQKITSPINLIHIGDFSRNKNVSSIIQSYQQLKKEGFELKLHLIGGKGVESNFQKKYGQDIDIIFYGFVSDKILISSLLKKSDIFVMPSHSETFGLVYIEALSQGIPVIYTKGEGIDGFYDKSIGECVNSRSLDSITDGIRKIILNYSNYNFNSNEMANNHNWGTIAKKYISIYESIISKYK